MKLTRIAQLISPRRREPQICEACAQPFVCGATLAGCWCTEIKLSEAVRHELKAQYQRCLCRACLERCAKADEQ